MKYIVRKNCYLHLEKFFSNGQAAFDYDVKPPGTVVELTPEQAFKHRAHIEVYIETVSC